MRRVNDIYLELKWVTFLSKFGIENMFSRDMLNNFSNASFALAIATNLVFVTGYKYREREECIDVSLRTFRSIYLHPRSSWNQNPELSEYAQEMPCLSSFQNEIVAVLNWLQILVSISTLILYLVVVSKPKFDLSLTDLTSRSIRMLGFNVPEQDYRLFLMIYRNLGALWFSIADGFPPGLYYLVYALTCFLVHRVYPPLCAFLLLDIVVKSPATASVLMAVYKPRKQLGYTLILLIFVVYIYAAFYFFSFRLQFTEGVFENCRSLLECFSTTLNYGTRLSGGVGDLFEHSVNSGRSVIDFLFFMTIIVVLLNIVFGIIIDTFAELRMALVDREIATKNFCFICGISSETFEREAQFKSTKGAINTGWTDHYKKVRVMFLNAHIFCGIGLTLCLSLFPFLAWYRLMRENPLQDHNIWNYSAFLIALKEQDKDDDDGIELFVRKCMESEIVDW